MNNSHERRVPKIAHVDSQVLLAAMECNVPKGAPEWIWFSEIMTTFGRWSKHESQVAYIRADLVVRAIEKSCSTKGTTQ